MEYTGSSCLIQTGKEGIGTYTILVFLLLDLIFGCTSMCCWFFFRLTPPLRWPPVHRFILNVMRLFGRARLSKTHEEYPRKTREIEWFFSCDTFTARASPHLPDAAFSFIRRVFIYSCATATCTSAKSTRVYSSFFPMVFLLLSSLKYFVKNRKTEEHFRAFESDWNERQSFFLF